MVRELFGVTPDAWQLDVLQAFPHNPRMAMKAAKGPGKTGCLAWLCWNFLLTRPKCNIGAVSITAQNLADGLWKEMAKWREKSELLQAAFTITSERIFQNEFPKTWFMVAKSWSRSASTEQQANTLAGFHADFIMFVLDESGGMPDAVMVAAEAALSSCIEGHIVQAGNPTHLEGPLWRASTTGKQSPTNPNGWWLIEITGDPDDPKRSPRISVEWARDQIRQYGADNAWVLVNVFGRFPPSSLNVLIGPDEVRDAMNRYYRPFEIGNASKVLGVDVARFGDDSSVIFPRHGIQAMKPRVLRGVDSIQGAGATARTWIDFDADACFVDDTGGFGSAWIDQLRQLGRAPIPVGFGNAAHDNGRYFNKRTEMHFDAIEWIKAGGALPDCPELLAALTQTTYTFKGDRLLLEPKDVVKAKLGYSPDHGDAFVCTFAEPVHPKKVTSGAARFTADYDPFAQVNKAPQHSFESDPFGR